MRGSNNFCTFIDIDSGYGGRIFSAIENYYAFCNRIAFCLWSVRVISHFRWFFYFTD